MLLAFWTYRFVAVPWIEPSAGRWQSDTLIEFGPPPDRLAGLHALFAPGAWELDELTKILESDRVKLLWQKDLTDQGDRNVELVPFTMIFLGGGSTASEAERARLAYVLQAPKALLTFDRPVDLRKGDIGRLEKGQLCGRVTIRSLGKLPGPQDDLLLVTRDVELTQERLWTPHAVEFTWGRSSGRGEELAVKFLPGDRGDGGKKHGLNIGGLEAVKVSRLEKLQLDLGSAATLFGKAKTPASRQARQPDNAQVEITCQGPVVFDPAEQVLVLRDRVDVRQTQPDGPSDQVSCEVLAVWFARRRNPLPGKEAAASKTVPANLRPLAELQPQRIEAHGNPVVIRAPSQQIEARGERLEYDLQTDKVVLDDAQGAVLRRARDEIHARHLEYQLAPSGRLGQALADGPGRLRIEMQGRADQPLTARWTRQLRLQPQDQQHVLSLVGGGEVSYGALGGLSAGEIHFWLQEIARPNDPRQIIPDRMLARDNVQFNSAKVSGDIGELRVWFEAPASGPQPGPGVNPPAAQPLQGPGNRAAPAGPPGEPIPGGHFHVEASVLKARLVLAGSGAELSELILEDKVRLRETQTAQPADKPVLITGDRVHVLDASKPYAAATVTGNLAYVEGRGLSMSGPNIHVNCGTNQLRVQGPGSMELPLDRDFQGRPLRDPLPLAIQWRHGMALDGPTVRFEEAVSAAAQGQELETELLEVAFVRPIRLADALNIPEGDSPVFATRKLGQSPNPAQSPLPRPEIKRIVCRGKVLMKGWEIEGGQPISFQRTEVAELDMDMLTGALSAMGPCHATTVRRQMPGLAAAVGSPGRATPAQPVAQTKPLTCLDIRCQGPLTGNLHHRELVFQEQVQAVYLPVDSWETVPQSDDPALLGPDAIVMHCDRLAAAQMLVQAGGARGWDVQATGNPRVEGEGFFARGARMSFDEAKGLLVLEGEPRADAVLLLQKRQEYRGQQVLYWLKTGKVDSSVRSLDLNSLRSLKLDGLLRGSGSKR